MIELEELSHEIPPNEMTSIPQRRLPNGEKIT